MNMFIFESQKLYIKEQYEKLNDVLCRQVYYMERTKNICVDLLNDAKHDKLVLV